MTAPPPSLDLKENNRNTWPCGSRVVVSYGDVNGQRVKTYKRIYCKVWGCEFCGPRRARALCRSIARCAEQHGLDRLLTLTLDPSKIGSGDPYKLIRRVWAKFRVYLRRKTGERVAFIEVVERQRNGMPHLHVLVSHYLEQAWISRTWDRLGGGRIAHIERVVDLARVGFYLGKYLSKDAILGVPRGVRRFSSSRGIHLREKAEPGVWKILPGTMEGAYDRHKRNIVSEKADSNGNVSEFEIPWRVDRWMPDVANGGFFFGPFTEAEMPREFVGSDFELIAVRDAPQEREDDEFWRDLLEGIEQGTVGRRLLDPGPEEAA